MANQILTDKMKTCIYANNELSKTISIESGVRQGDLLAVALLVIVFAIVILQAFTHNDASTYISITVQNERKTSSIISLHWPIHDLLYTDECNFVTDTEVKLQLPRDCFFAACDEFEQLV